MGNLEIPKWLEGLPLAPEFRPTDTEFADPIAYISKIEKEAGAFGICKVIPPLPKPSKKYVFSNLNDSLSKRPELGSHGKLSASKIGSLDGGGDGEFRAVFTTRQQELGQNAKKSKGAVQNQTSGVHKQVWQSGEIYTLEQFEAKSKAFAKSQLGMVKEASPLVVEAMFWKAALEKPIYLEYANDVPGSGFGEPEGQFRHFHRRRRKRNFFRRSGESSGCKMNEIVGDRIYVPRNDDGKDISLKSDSDLCLDVPESPTSPPILPANEASQSSKKKSHSSCFDKERTAGWKISNSPWNLQVISRSPGSLTRFMPDDIPGVTSPMVYIGMLFSWFAWHVEDHELHSMNFLHTGSSKTWYSVPGDCAFAFEEVVRSEAYGGNIDRIAGLALLGEKTTLMSPEVVVASGIPCCRLVQNPGEFVVTFPRAYHVGFSHGFNCGEAANFGTPQWLKVAKEAAVRRAAMNYLPMLSHQQLLYLLMMSFVSRVPRALLPGVRSSRLRDRQKEERELLVKKAFIEDILQENSTLSVLLGKDSGYRAVLWNPDLLTYPSKETLLPGAAVTGGTISAEKPSQVDPKEHNNNLFDEMSLYMENLDDLYLGSDDLSCDFQVDSGTLACVACGILGFPFMSVVQPSEKASLEFLHHDHRLGEERHGMPGYSKSSSSKILDSPNTGSFKEKLLTSALNPSSEADLSSKSIDGWNALNKLLRPRSFCLEHAVEIVELLQCKGGANVLVICHSDYQKIKAHATTIAEEIGSSFNYKDVPLDKASKEDLNLIDLAIDNEERNGYREDWTSKLGINLRHCVKIRKNSPSKQVQHALTLGGLFSNKCQASDFSGIKWQLRRSRSKKIYYPADIKSSNSSESNNDVMEESSVTIKKEVKIIQYSRRNFKRKQGDSAGAGKGCGSHAIVEQCEQSGIKSERDNRNGGNSNSFSFSSSNWMSRMQSEIQIPEHKRDKSLEAGLGSVETQIESRTLVEMNVDSRVHNLASSDSMMQGEPNVETKTASYANEGNEKSFEVHEEGKIEGQSRTNEACSLASEMHSYVDADDDVLARSLSNSSEEGNVEQTSIAAVESLAVDDEVVSGVHASETNNEPVLCNSTTGCNNERPVSCSSTINDHPVASTDEFFEGPRETCSAECSSNDKPLTVNADQIRTESYSNGKILEIIPQQVKSRINEYPHDSIEETSEVPKETHSTDDLSNSISLAIEAEQEINNTIVETLPVSTEEASEVPSDSVAASKMCDGLTLDNEMPQKVVAHAGRTEEFASSSVTQMKCSTVSRRKSLEEDVGNDVISDQEVLTKSGKHGLFSIVGGQTGKQPNHEGESEVPYCAQDHFVDGLTSNNIAERRCQDSGEAGMRTEKLSSASEVCSPEIDRELNSTEFNVRKSDSNAKKGGKRKREIELLTENKLICRGYIRSPCEGLRPRAGKDAATASSETKIDVEVKEKPKAKMKKKPSTTTTRAPPKDNKEEQQSGKSHKCDIEGCRMSFNTKAELSLHKRNRCPHEGCGKRFSSHKYAMIHHRVHDDERPLKCPWKGCSMSFKWAWARTEHIRVHTGERPYKCKIEGCGLSFRFVSDFSRHRRKTGHFVN